MGSTHGHDDPWLIYPLASFLGFQIVILSRAAAVVVVDGRWLPPVKSWASAHTPCCPTRETCHLGNPDAPAEVHQVRVGLRSCKSWRESRDLVAAMQRGACRKP